MDDCLFELNGRLEFCWEELEKEVSCVILGVYYYGCVLVLFYLECFFLELVFMVSDWDIECIVIDKVMEYERGRGW